MKINARAVRLAIVVAVSAWAAWVSYRTAAPASDRIGFASIGGGPISGGGGGLPKCSLDSNAANLAISFYATNQPSWQVTLIETRCFAPMTRWERLKDSAWVYWHRCKAFLHL